jgi:hypothetical protein
VLLDGDPEAAKAVTAHVLSPAAESTEEKVNPVFRVDVTLSLGQPDGPPPRLIDGVEGRPDSREDGQR